MAVQKLRADNTYMFPGCSSDNPKLGAKRLSDGRESLFLDYYFGYSLVVDEATGKRTARKNRRRVSLSLYLWYAPGTPEKRRQNRETLDLARRIRFEKEQQMKEDRLGYRLRKGKEADFLAYFQDFCDNYVKKDRKVVRMALNRFRDFLTTVPRYSGYLGGLGPGQVTRDMVSGFAEYLKGRSTGYGAWSTFQRFKKVVNHAVREGLFAKSPCEGVTIKADDNILVKDILSVDEIRQLVGTEVRGMNPEVRRAFIFCLYTGLRFCDVKGLTFSNLDFSNRLLKFEQGKTRGRSSSSGVVIPLNDWILHLADSAYAAAGGDRHASVFDLPSYETCLKGLKRWVRAAGIRKRISWHCARHSFAVNILNNGANIKTVASLLGHSSLKYTEKYTRAVDRLKRDAIDSLPQFWE